MPHPSAKPILGKHTHRVLAQRHPEQLSLFTSPTGSEDDASGGAGIKPSSAPGTETQLDPAPYAAARDDACPAEAGELATSNQSSVMEPIAKPEDLSYDLARRAHEGTSFVPEQRAKQAQQAYADDVNGFYERMAELAKTNLQRTLLDKAIQTYKTTYLQKYGDYLRSHGNVVSTMIAGPSNFPVARMEKRSRWADNKRDAFLEWKQKAEAAIRKTILEARPEEEKDHAEWIDLSRDLTRSLNAIADIDAGSSPYTRSAFVNSIAGKVERLAHNGEAELVEHALALIRNYNADHRKPAFTERHKIWTYRNVAWAAKARLAGRADTPSTVVAAGDGYTIERNVHADRVQIFFDEKPDEAVRSKLRGAGWKWSPTNDAWQRKLTDNAIASAKQIVER
jgi:hypothetical protein